MIYEMHDARRQIASTLEDYARNPRAWVLIANPVWGRMETENVSAFFDTREALDAYGIDNKRGRLELLVKLGLA